MNFKFFFTFSIHIHRSKAKIAISVNKTCVWCSDMKYPFFTIYDYNAMKKIFASCRTTSEESSKPTCWTNVLDWYSNCVTIVFIISNNSCETVKRVSALIDLYLFVFIHHSVCCFASLHLHGKHGRERLFRWRIGQPPSTWRNCWSVGRTMQTIIHGS